MRWFGVGLMMASALVGLIVWFGLDENMPWTIGAIIFFVIGFVAFVGARERKTTEKIEKEIHSDEHTDKHE